MNLVPGLILVTILLAAFSIDQSRKIDSLREELSSSKAEIEGMKSSVEIRSKYDFQLKELSAEKSEVDYDLSISEGGDDPLPAYLGRAAERLWP